MENKFSLTKFSFTNIWPDHLPALLISSGNWGNSDLDSGQIDRGKANRGQINSRQVNSRQAHNLKHNERIE